MYRSILIPTDGTGITKKSLKELENVASENSIVHIVSVVDLSIYEKNNKLADTLYVEDRTQAKKAIKNVEKKIEDKGYEVKSKIMEGWPSDSIVSYYKSNDIDVIIMTTHGSKKLDESVTQKVVQKVDAPVLTRGSNEE